MREFKGTNIHSSKILLVYERKGYGLKGSVSRGNEELFEKAKNLISGRDESQRDRKKESEESRKKCNISNKTVRTSPAVWSPSTFIACSPPCLVVRFRDNKNLAATKGPSASPLLRHLHWSQQQKPEARGCTSVGVTWVRHLRAPPAQI